MLAFRDMFLGRARSPLKKKKHFLMNVRRLNASLLKHWRGQRNGPTCNRPGSG